MKYLNRQLTATYLAHLILECAMRLNPNDATYSASNHNPPLHLQKPLLVAHNLESVDSFTRSPKTTNSNPHFGAQYVRAAELGIKMGDHYNKHHKAIDYNTGWVGGFTAQLVSPSYLGPKVTRWAEGVLREPSGTRHSSGRRRSPRKKHH